MRVNVRQRQLELKVVFYGPGLSGKTTNLAWLHDNLPPEARGRLIQLDTEGERTLFFDYFPYDLGTVGDYDIKVDFFTVPGQSFYQATRRAVLDGVDGIIFVADSAPEREAANLLSHDDMRAALEERGRSLDEVPHVYQWNKQDLPNAVSPSVLERMLNPEKAASVTAIAAKGEGVLEAKALVLEEVLVHVSR
ncbi:MAG: gliding-motility protein MglA [Alphaproteobacteria bacterium]|nr:gliding-motility protein MglA [Alphaproteobacteria bacterium]